MGFLPEEIMKNLLKSYKPSSTKVMEGRVKRYFRDVLDGIDYDHLALLDPEGTYENIVATFDKTSVRKDIFNSIKNVLKYVDFDDKERILDEYQTYYQKLIDDHIAKRDAKPKPKLKVRPKFRMKKTVVAELAEPVKPDKPASELIEPSTSDPREYMHYLIQKLYQVLPPLKGEDYYNTKIISSKLVGDDLNIVELSELLDYNFYDIDTSSLVLTMYSISDRIGRRIITVSDELSRIIGKWSKINETEYLVPNLTKLTAMSPRRFGELVKKLMGFSIRDLRIAYVQNKVPTMNRMNRGKLANIMGISVITLESML